ncbi:unnamed protein product, partial [Ilex paraguariensis]
MSLSIASSPQAAIPFGLSSRVGGRGTGRCAWPSSPDDPSSGATSSSNGRFHPGTRTWTRPIAASGRGACGNACKVCTKSRLESSTHSGQILRWR